MIYIPVQFGAARCSVRPCGAEAPADRLENEPQGRTLHRAFRLYPVGSLCLTSNVRHYGPVLAPGCAGAAGASQEQSDGPRGVRFDPLDMFTFRPAAPLSHAYKQPHSRLVCTGRRSVASTRASEWVWRVFSVSVLVA